MAPGGGDMSSQKVPMGDPSELIHWTTPAGWQTQAPGAMRVASFSVAGVNGGKAEVAVTHFPGSVGSEESNVNRWRREVGLSPITETEVTSEPVTVDADTGKLYDFTGITNRTVVADVPHNGESWFFKMHGDKETVTAGREEFVEFLKSVKFTEANMAAGADGANPHAGLGLPSPAAMGAAQDPTGNGGGDVTGGAGASPDVNTPANWHERQPGPMIQKAYAVGDDSAAMVTISSFPGVMGGVLANVNRWRGQLQLGPVAADALATVTQAAESRGAPATLVDFTGTDAKTGKPARMVAVIVPRGDSTAFYKLMGDPAVVGREKDRFMNFVRNAPEPSP